MVFFLNYLCSLLFAFAIGKLYSHIKVSAGALLGLLLPIFLIWLYISGGQYDVGTDYWSYYTFFNGIDIEQFRVNGEYLFVGIIRLCNFMGLYGQSLFYIFYGINFYFFYLILKRVDRKHIYLFILLYITVSNLFNNQLNMVRQATAIYIVSYGLILLSEKKKLKALLFILIAAMFHRTAWFLLPIFCITKFVSRLSCRSQIILMGIALCCSFVLRMEMLEILSPILPERFAWYITGFEYEDKSFISKLPKFIYIPFYLMAFLRFDKMRLNESEAILFKWGVVAFCLRLMVLNLSIANRLCDYFLILSLFPFYFYLRYLLRNNCRFAFVSIIFLFSLLYALKVTVFARNEYLYESVYFH